MSIAAMILGEFEGERASTRRLLAAVPQDKLDWKPHEKSMTLARLAGHTAEIFGWAQGMIEDDVLDISDYEGFLPRDTASLLEFYDQGADSFHQAFSSLDESKLGDMWSLKRGDDVLFAAPRMAAIRAFVLNHLIHHRGQLTVYLRLLDVPLPHVYGPTADAPAF